MSYEQKYIKYKLKYFKLLLESKSEQKGGVLEFIYWPREAEKIKIGDKLKIVRFGDSDIKARWNYPVLMHNPIGIVESNNEKRLMLIELKATTTPYIEILPKYEFFLNDFPNGIIFEKVNLNENLDMQKNSEIENLQEQIKQLENKQKELESKLENHYHILPTSGMKSFEQAHPYYNKKLD